MNIYDAIMFETDLQREHYISGLELVDMLENSQGNLEPDTIIAFLEAIKVFELPMYHIGFGRKNKPEYSTIGINRDMSEDLSNYFKCKADFIADKGWQQHIFDAHDAAQRKVSSCYWEKADLLKLESLVENSSLVTWGEKRVLRHMYANIIENNKPLFLSFAKNAQKGIKEFMSVTEIGGDSQSDDAENTQVIEQINNNSLASYITEYTLPQVAALILNIDLADITTSSNNSYIHEQNKYDESTYSKFNNLVQSYSTAALNNKLDGANVFTRTIQNFFGAPDTQTDLEKTTISRGKLANYLDSIGYQLDDLIAKQEPIHTQNSQHDSYQQNDSELVLSLQQQVADIQSCLDEKDKELKAKNAKLDLAQNKIKDLDKPASNDQQLSDNTAKDYQVTIGMLLELLRTPKGCDKEGKPNKALFSTQTSIVAAITKQFMLNHGETKVSERFTASARALAEAKRNRDSDLEEKAALAEKLKREAALSA